MCLYVLLPTFQRMLGNLQHAETSSQHDEAWKKRVPTLCREAVPKLASNA